MPSDDFGNQLLQQIQKNINSEDSARNARTQYFAPVVQPTIDAINSITSSIKMLNNNDFRVETHGIKNGPNYIEYYFRFYKKGGYLYSGLTYSDHWNALGIEVEERNRHLFSHLPGYSVHCSNICHVSLDTSPRLIAEAFKTLALKFYK